MEADWASLLLPSLLVTTAEKFEAPGSAAASTKVATTPLKGWPAIAAAALAVGMNKWTPPLFLRLPFSSANA